MSFSQTIKSLIISHSVRNLLWRFSNTTPVPNYGTVEKPQNEGSNFETNMEPGRKKYTEFSNNVKINKNVLTEHREGASFPATKPQHEFRINEEEGTKRINLNILIKSEQE